MYECTAMGVLEPGFKSTQSYCFSSVIWIQAALSLTFFLTDIYLPPFPLVSTFSCLSCEYPVCLVMIAIFLCVFQFFITSSKSHSRSAVLPGSEDARSSFAHTLT